MVYHIPFTYTLIWYILSGGTSLKTLVGIFLLVLKSNGIKIFLINDNKVIIRKLELSMTWKCLKNRIEYNFGLYIVYNIPYIWYILSIIFKSNIQI